MVHQAFLPCPLDDPKVRHVLALFLVLLLPFPIGLPLAAWLLKRPS